MQRRHDGPRPPFLGAFGQRLFLALALLSLLLVAAVGGLGYSQTRRALMDDAREHLGEVARNRRARLETWFDERRDDMVLLTGLLEAELTKENPDPDSLREILAMQLDAQSAYRHFCIIADEKGLLASAGDPVHPACSYDDCPEVLNAREQRKVVLGRFQLDAADEPIMRLSAPLWLNGEIAGVLLSTMRPARSLQPILSDISGLGETGETYLIGADTTMLTPSRHMNHPPALTHKMPTPGVLACLRGESGVDIYRAYMGQEVLGAYEWLPEQNWALLAEMQTAEAFAPLRSIARNTLLLAGLVLLLALLLGIPLSRRLSRPIGLLAAASERVAAGDWTPLPPIAGPGEIGRLARRFSEMTESLAGSKRALEQASRKLARAEKLAEIGRLAAGLVHEMRNPLAAVKMNVSTMARSRSLSDVEREQVQIAREEGERLELMLDEFLAFSRPVVILPAPVRSAVLAEKAAQLSRAECERRAVTLCIDLGEAPAVFAADSELLLRALVNLLHNAAQASEPGSEIHLSLRAVESELLLTVADAGRGMSAQTLERVRDPFFTTREDGIGLGLSNVCKYVELHEGRLEISSVEGEGSRVAIRMPLNEAGEKHA